jgi:hypothetical protein
VPPPTEPGAARAPSSVSQLYAVSDLAALKIPITALNGDQLAGAVFQVLDPGVGPCKVKIQEGGILGGKSDECDALWAQDDPSDVSLTVKSPKFEGVLVLKAEPLTRKAGEFAQPSFESLKLVFTSVPAFTKASLYVPGSQRRGRWVAIADGDGKTLSVDGLLGPRVRGVNSLRFVATVGEQRVLFDLTRNQVSFPGAAPDLLRPKLDQLDCRQEAIDQGYQPGTSAVFCVDTTADQQLKLGALPQDEYVVPPNKPIFVVVGTWDDNFASVSMTGTVGLSDPKLSANVPQSGIEKAGMPPIPEVHTRQVTVWPFAPRVSGQTPTVTVKVMKKADHAVNVDQISFDLIVDSLYYGALRLGVGVGFGSFDRGYAAQNIGGGAINEVVATANTNVNLELVLGFAPFLERSGRSYTRGVPVAFAPYIGVGVLAQGNKGIEAFKSFHIGGEIELGRNFSIALTFVGRFVSTLPPNTEVGSPVPSGILSTRTGFAGGGALVFNLAPEFFKFAINGIK